MKLRHLATNPNCVLVEAGVTAARTAIAGRYLGERAGAQFAAERRSKPGVVLRLVAREPRLWDLAAILPS